MDLKTRKGVLDNLHRLRAAFSNPEVDPPLPSESKMILGAAIEMIEKGDGAITGSRDDMFRKELDRMKERFNRQMELQSRQLNDARAQRDGMGEEMDRLKRENKDLSKTVAAMAMQIYLHGEQDKGGVML